MDFDIPESHSWYWRVRTALSITSVRKPSSTMDPNTQEALRYLNQMKEKTPLGPTVDKGIEIITETGKTFWFNKYDFQKYARCINEKYQYQYRVDPNTEKIQFFSKEIKLTEIEQYIPNIIISSTQKSLCVYVQII